jgi:hypothetical protein
MTVSESVRCCVPPRRRVNNVTRRDVSRTRENNPEQSRDTEIPRAVLPGATVLLFIGDQSQFSYSHGG